MRCGICRTRPRASAASDGRCSMTGRFQACSPPARPTSRSRPQAQQPEQRPVRPHLHVSEQRRQREPDRLAGLRGEDRLRGRSRVRLFEQPVRAVQHEGGRRADLRQRRHGVRAFPPRWLPRPHRGPRDRQEHPHGRQPQSPVPPRRVQRVQRRDLSTIGRGTSSTGARRIRRSSTRSTCRMARSIRRGSRRGTRGSAPPPARSRCGTCSCRFGCCSKRLKGERREGEKAFPPFRLSALPAFLRRSFLNAARPYRIGRPSTKSISRKCSLVTFTPELSSSTPMIFLAAVPITSPVDE